MATIEMATIAVPPLELFPVGVHRARHVMPGLVPGIHAFLQVSKTWMAGARP
jgi:hypothetical protein